MMTESELREILVERENTRSSRNLYNSYRIGGIQLENLMDVTKDYLAELEKKYPGIIESIRVKAKF